MNKNEYYFLCRLVSILTMWKVQLDLVSILPNGCQIYYDSCSQWVCSYTSANCPETAWKWEGQILHTMFVPCVSRPKDKHRAIMEESRIQLMSCYIRDPLSTIDIDTLPRCGFDFTNLTPGEMAGTYVGAICYRIPFKCNQTDTVGRSVIFDLASNFGRYYDDNPFTTIRARYMCKYHIPEHDLAVTEFVIGLMPTLMLYEKVKEIDGGIHFPR